MTQLLLDPAANVKKFQWFTPEWAAFELVERFFPDLGPADLVVEPSAGLGAFLKAIPAHVPAIGVEIDPEIAEQCRQNTGREVITADFGFASLPHDVTAAIGNPPFSVPVITRFIARLGTLPLCSRAGFLLPAYALQTHNTVVPWLDRWRLRAEIIPRRLFPGLKLPLVFTMFERGQSREMVGFALYREAVEFDRMGETAREVLTNGRPRRNVWRALVEEILKQLGGEADLAEIYRAIEPKRPTPNAWWKEKVRQILQRHFEPVFKGRWRQRPCAES